MHRGRFELPRQQAVTFGEPMASAVTAEADRIGATRILPVVTGSLAGHEAVAGLMDRLGARALPPFTALKPNTPFDVVMALAGRLRDGKPDLVAVIGGGSAIDAVKVASVALVEGVVAADNLMAVTGYQGASTTKPRPFAVVGVPTTLSAAEFGTIGGATDPATGTKHPFRAAFFPCDIVVQDPVLALATPLDLWLSTGMRAVDHAVEGILSPDANPYVDALSLAGLRSLTDGLARSKTDPGEPAARQTCQFGVWLAAAGIGRVRYGASHGIGHQLGALTGMPHGVTSCVLLPAVLDYNAGVVGARYGAIGAVFGVPGDGLPDALRRFLAGLGLPTRIRDTGAERTVLPRVAASCLANPFVKANPRPVATEADALAILEAAW
jgi:alcohol dehydrogenase class IV